MHGASNLPFLMGISGIDNSILSQLHSFLDFQAL
jgi:hypothetical protein